eukprot:1387755-Amorphochlora_amoeboformis.AAC.3
MSSLPTAEAQVGQVVDQGEKRQHEIMAELENPPKRQRLEQSAPMQHAQADPDPQHDPTHDDASKEIKVVHIRYLEIDHYRLSLQMLLQMEAAKKRPPKPSPASGKQSMRCQVCIRAKKGGCGTDRAVYRCLRRPGGPRAASLLIPPGDAKDQGSRRKANKKPEEMFFDITTRVHAKFQGQWHPGIIRRVHRSKATPYGVKLDADKDNTLLLWVVKDAVLRDGMQHPDVPYIAGEDSGYKEDESQTLDEEPKRMPSLSAATSPLLGISPADMMQQMHPSMASKFHAVVRDAATGGVKLCRKCNQPALPGNYGFCAMHRTPRSRGSGKHEGAQAASGLGAGAQQLRSVALPPNLAFPQNMPSIIQRALQAQAMPISSGTTSATGSPFAVPSMAMGSIAPPLLPGVPGFLPQSAEATPVATASATGNASQGLTAGMMMMPRGSQDIPIVYGSVEGFLPNQMTGATATPVVEAEAEVVNAPQDGGELQVSENKAVEIPQATVAAP